jgi:hypothetical protein
MANSANVQLTFSNYQMTLSAFAAPLEHFGALKNRDVRTARQISLRKPALSALVV